MENVIKTFKLNKMPGNDSLPVEFYVQFWMNLNIPMKDSFNYSYDN